MAKSHYEIFLSGVAKDAKDQVLAVLDELGVWYCYANRAVCSVSTGASIGEGVKLYGYQTEEQVREKIANLTAAGAMVEMR